MMTFEYRGLDSSGKVCRGLLEAVEVKQARAELLRRGIMVEKNHRSLRRGRPPF